MPYRQTVVFEYDSIDAAPSVGPGTTDFGPGRVVSVQFSDALAEVQVLHEDASENAKDRAFYAANHGWEPIVLACGAAGHQTNGKCPACGQLQVESLTAPPGVKP